MGPHNIALSAVIYGGIPLPKGGSDEWALLTPDARYEVQDGVNGPIFSKMIGRKFVLTLSYYAGDPANAILRRLVNTDDAAQGLLPQPGLLIDSAGQSAAWTDARITQEAPVQVGRNATVQTWTITGGGFTIVQAPLL